MNVNDQFTGGDIIIDDLAGDDAAATPAPQVARAARLPQMMRRIPVTLTLEVGSARISLQELMDIGPSSVVPLDVLAGEPLVIKVNGTAIGRAEVVVAGEQYGLKVIDLEGLNLDLIAP
ncbi:flagellar motor switch protein FliN [Massilia forsythiae]|uniref:Flagellar motor switch protein FliN n=1 Tax=Massilia forsythiae TaxID=2728020 RepID=A0A7Z2VTN4_9BURK|nr:FliM/FliN family flagellar motor switch protein [Massilia forsythiae]QJD99023.1 flagellar motor switch protein FliN [Massilia forsythiae]